ncbi:ABC transporter permease [Streptomyces griseoluteus]|uniref:ABC transporter permease n=1 Tax=Streptomyces griseoluteus TaxID=29306 RepID=UPI0036C93EF7
MPSTKEHPAAAGRTVPAPGDTARRGGRGGARPPPPAPPGAPRGGAPQGARGMASKATGDNLGNIAISSSFLATVALGMTFVIVSGGIDLSVGSVFVLGGVLAAWGSQYGTVVALLLPLAVCAAIGLVNGLLVARTGLAPFIVTLASMLAARGLMLAITDEGADTFLVDPDSVFASLGQGKLLGIGTPVWITAVLFVGGAVLLRSTRFGQRVYAVGGNEQAAALMGAPVARTKISVYTLSGLLAGLAGALNAAYLASGVTILGYGMELDAIAAVVIGGTLLTGGLGYVSGSLVGVLLLKVIQNVINQIGSLDSAYQQVVSGAFLVLVVVAQTWLARRRRVG